MSAERCFEIAFGAAAVMWGGICCLNMYVAIAGAITAIIFLARADRVWVREERGL